MKLPLSVCYISYNEEDIIEKSINSIKCIASQIVVVDSFSNDNTVNLSKSMGAEVYLQEWLGFVDQKNKALSYCNEQWILLLDCDEIVTSELINEISEIIKNNKIGFYKINRRTHYLGKLMKYSWQPDKVVRLVHKSLKPKFVGSKVHEKIDTKGSKVEHLRNEIIHYSYKNIAGHFNKTVNYAKLSAESYIDKQKNANISNLIINPLFAFLKMYFFQLGFLDGWRGLLASYSSMSGTLLKYAMILENKSSKNTNR